MSALAGATSGLTLAMGDVRRLMAKVMTRLDAADVEHRAKTGEVPDSDRFVPNEARINTALRDKFPIPTSCMRDMAFELADEETAAQYCARARQVWTDRTGTDPDYRDKEKMMFRKALLEGIPDAVIVQMEDNPLMDDADAPLWLHHLIRYLEKYRKKAKDRAREGDEAREQLTKLQAWGGAWGLPRRCLATGVIIVGTLDTGEGRARTSGRCRGGPRWLWLWPWGLPGP